MAKPFATYPRVASYATPLCHAERGNASQMRGVSFNISAVQPAKTSLPHAAHCGPYFGGCSPAPKK